MEIAQAFGFSLFFTGFLSLWCLAMDSANAYFLRNLSEKVKQGANAQLWESLTWKVSFILRGAAIVLFVAALVVNVCSWISSDIVQHMEWLIALDLGIAFVFFAFIILQRWKWRMSGSIKYTFVVPRQSLAILAVLLLYIVFEFAFNGLRAHQENVADRPAGYQTQLEMSSEQKVVIQQRAVRNFSGLWILFSAIPAAGPLLVKRIEYEGPFGKFSRAVH